MPLGQRHLLLGGEQRDLADLLEVHPDRVEAADLARPLGPQVGDAVGAGGAATRGAGAARCSASPGRLTTGAATELGVARHGGRRDRDPPCSLVLALQLLEDLVDDLDAVRLEPA